MEGMTVPGRRWVYLDHAATSPLSSAAQEAMRAAEEQAFGNPSAAHWAGAAAGKVLEAAREAIRRRAGFSCRVVFTSGASEANAIGILGLLGGVTVKRVLGSAIEHDSVSAALEAARRLGASTQTVGVDRLGRVDPGHIARLLGGQPAVAAVTHASNEVGTLQPIREIAEAVHRAGGLLHVDAVQSFGKVDIGELSCADSVAVSAHKLGGPKGVGALLVREGTVLDPPLGGGAQEDGLRRGTQNVPGIAGFARAAAESAPGTVGAVLQARAEELRARLTDAVPEIRWTGDPVKRVPHIVSCLIPGVSGDVLTQSVSALGVAISAGSACQAGSVQPSPVLTAMGASAVEAACAVRLSVGLATSSADIEYAVDVIGECVRRLRSILLSARHAEPAEFPAVQRLRTAVPAER